MCNLNFVFAFMPLLVVSVSFRVTGAVYVFCVGLMLAAVLG